MTNIGSCEWWRTSLMVNEKPENDNGFPVNLHVLPKRTAKFALAFSTDLEVKDQARIIGHKN